MCALSSVTQCSARKEIRCVRWFLQVKAVSSSQCVGVCLICVSSAVSVCNVCVLCVWVWELSCMGPNMFYCENTLSQL